MTVRWKSEAAAPKGKLIDPKKWYVVDMTGKEFISSGPYASEKIALKQAKPDGPKGVIYEDVMTGEDCKANSIKWG